VSSMEIKRRMINATKKLLQTNVKVSIKDITDASFVNIAAVNYHFGSKEALIEIVLTEVIEDLKNYLTHEVLNNRSSNSSQENLEFVMNYLYNFAIEHMGLIQYLFLSDELQQEASSLLIRQFFQDNPFTSLVYESIASRSNSTNIDEIKVKYILLFSSFCIPLFLQVSQLRSESKEYMNLFTQESFRQEFMKQIMKIF
jgi:AcrR family transcriptional regulator